MAGRVVIIALAAIIVIGLTGVYARSLRQPIGRRDERRELRRRQPDGRLSAFPAFTRQCGIFVLIALLGRKALRLRL
jgi:hypothetical protein